MLSIKLKIVLSYTIIFGVLLSLFALIIYHSTEKADVAKLDTKLKSYSILLQSEMEEQSREDSGFNYKDFKSVSSDGLKMTGFQFFDSNSKMVIGDTIITKPDAKLTNSILNGSDKFERIKINGHRSRIYYSPVEIEEKTDHILVVSSSLGEVHEDLERLLLLFLIIIPSGLILAGFSAYWIAKKAFKPVNNMISTANEISAYSLDKRLNVPKTNDEVKSLSITLNSMIDRIDKTFKSHRQFIADASHEIRTPLTVIQTELELALKKITDKSSKEGIKTSLIEIENLSRLTNSLLTLAKIDAQKNKLEIRKVRLDELILDCVQLLKPYADQNNNKIDISIDDVVEYNGDREKLKSVIINILDNAIKYSGTGKEIYISLNKVNYGQIFIKVKDNGPGISTNDLPHIFERFYRSTETRSSVEGNGLGLAIVKGFVEMHGGEINVSSIPGQGTIFVVKLPV
jgi:hypothetical protein